MAKTKMTWNDSAEMADQVGKLARAQQARQVTQGANYNKYRVPLDLEQQQIFEGIRKLSPEGYRPHVDNYLARAAYIHDLYNVPLREAVNRANEYSLSLYPNLKTPDKALWHLEKAAKLGAITMQAGYLGAAMMARGETESEELDGLLEEQSKLGEGVASNQFTKVLGDVTQSLVMTGPGTAAGLAAGALFTPMVGAAVSMAANAPLYAGLSYIDMIKSGIDKDVAGRHALLSGSFQAIVDGALDIVPVGGFARSYISKSIGKNLFAKGTAKTLAGKMAKRGMFELGLNIAGVPWQGLEEIIQDGAANIMLEMAALESDKSLGGVNWAEVRGRKQDLEESFKGGIYMALVLGLPSAAYHGAVTTAQAKRSGEVIQEAVTTSKTQEEAKAKIEKALPDFLTEDALDEATQTLPTIEGLRPTAKTDAPARWRDGTLPYDIDDQAGILRVHDPEEHGRQGNSEYGNLEYEIKGDKININAANFTKGLTDKNEVMKYAAERLAATHPDKNVVWNVGDTAAPDGVNISRKAEKALTLKEIKSNFEKILDVKTDVKIVDKLPAHVKAPKGETVKGAWIGKDENGNNVIYITKHADASTLPHEMLHAWATGAAPEKQAQIMRALEKAAGLEAGSVKDLFRDEAFTSRDGKRINGHEALAEYWEDYLAKENKNIPAEIKAFFDKLAVALRNVLKHLGKEIPPEIEAIFNDIVNRKNTQEKENGQDGQDFRETEEVSGSGNRIEHDEVSRQYVRGGAETDSGIGEVQEEAAGGTGSAGGGSVRDIAKLPYERVKARIKEIDGEVVNMLDAPRPTGTANLAADDGRISALNEERDALSARLQELDAIRKTPRQEVYSFDGGQEAPLYSLKDPKTGKVVGIDPAVMVDENGNQINYHVSKEIKKWFKDNLVGSTVTIDDDGKIQEFTNRGLKASLKKKRQERHNEVYGQLAPLIKNAVFDHEEAANAKHAGIVSGQRVYHAAAKIDDELYGVKLRLDIPISETTLNYKDHDVKKIDILPSQSPTYVDKNQPAIRLAHVGSISEVSLDVLTGKVKPSQIKDGVLFQLAGEQGAAALDRREEATTRLDNLAVARDMETAGKDAKSVRLATGWERGADGKWRYEIEDKLSKISFKYTSGALSDFYDNKELFAAYPELADIAVFIDDAEGADGGFGEFEDGNTDEPGLKSIHINEGLTLAEKKKTLLHEIQHAIQEIEGFAPSIDSADYGKYHKSAGEVEARNVENRSKLTSDQRRASLLADTEDVARNDQIFLESGQEMPLYSVEGQSDNEGMSEKINAVNNAISEITNGAEEAIAKNIRPDLSQYGGNGDVNFIWGNEKMGLYHIGYRRGADAVKKVLEAVISGKIARYSAIKKTIVLEKDGFEAVLSLDMNGQDKTWLLTGWKKNQPDATGEVGTQSGATQNRPMFSRSNLGAGLTSLSTSPAEKSSTVLEQIDDPGEKVLFQLTEGEIAADAQGYESWEAWRDASEAGRGDFKIDENGELVEGAAPNGELTPAELDAWYKSRWEASHVELEPDKGLKTSELDRRFLRTMDKDFDHFREQIEATQKNIEGAEDRDEAAELAGKVRQLAHPLFWVGADKARGMRDIKDSSKKTLLTHIRNNPTQYRMLDAMLNPESELAGAAAREVYDKPFIHRAMEEGEGLSAQKIGELARRLQSEDVRAKAERREETSEDLIAVIKTADADIAALEADKKALTEKLAETRDDLAWVEKYNKSLEEKNKEAQRLLKKLERNKERAKKLKAERRAAKLLLAERKKLAARIVTPPASSVDLKYRQQIIAAQEAFLQGANPVKKGTKITFEGQTRPIEEFREKVGRGEIDLGFLDKRGLDRYFRKSLEELNTSDLLDLNAKMEALRAEGRAEWKNRQAKRKARDVAAAQGLMNDFVRDNKAKIDQYNALKTQDERDKFKKKNPAIEAYFTFKEDDYIFHNLGQGIYDEIIRGKENAFNAKHDVLDRRIADVLQTAADNKLDLNKLSKRDIEVEGVGADNVTVNYSLSDLMGIDVLLKNERARAHVLYGNLLSVDERKGLARRAATLKNIKPLIEHIEETIGKPKEALLRAAVDKHLTSEMRALQDKILADFESRYGALEQFVYEMTNEDLGKESNFLPLEVLGRVGKEKEDIKEAMRIGTSTLNLSPEKGFTIERVDLLPWHQSPVSLDIMKMHSKGAEREEHLIAYGETVRHLNAVFKGRGLDSQSLMDKIETVEGAHIKKHIEEYINLLAEPNAERASMAESALEQMVGKMGVAAIGGNLLAWLKQYPQSTAPFLAHAPPGFMVAAAAAYAKAQKGLSGNALVDEVRAMSAVMRNRTRLVEKEYIKFAQENAKTPAGRKMAQLAEKLFILQDAADTTCVTIGWKAVYDATRAQGKSDKEAVRQADWVVNRTQPTVEATEIMAGLRKGKGHLPRFLTMFAMPGSKIFGMYMDGLPRAVREKNMRFIVGHLLSQAVSGLACAWLAGAFKGDDDEDKKKRAAYAATLEPLLGTVPLPYLSNVVTWGAESLIGISKSQYPSANYLPLVDSGAKTVVDIKKILSADGKKKEKALKALVRDGLSTTGYATGLPAAQVNRTLRAILEDEGAMGALLGWR